MKKIKILPLKYQLNIKFPTLNKRYKGTNKRNNHLYTKNAGNNNSHFKLKP